MLRRSTVISILVVAFASAPVVGAQAPPAVKQPPSVEELLDRSGRFVQQLGRDLTFVVGDETYQQAVSDGSGGRTRDSRKLESEMFFMWLPEEQIWLSVRNVLVADGRRVPDSKERLNRALADSPSGLASRFRRLQEDNARFDIGPLYRTLGYPTLVLQFLPPSHQSRFTFTRAGAERVGGADAWKVTFVERQTPTEVSFNDEDLLSAGTIWIRDVDGAIVRTQLHLTTANRTDMLVTVNFRRDAKLNVWVPSTMEERYREQGGQLTTCHAAYSNFHRFETSARVILPD